MSDQVDVGVWFQVLGPLAISHRGEPIHLPSHRQRVILTMLLLNRTGPSASPL